MKTNQKATINVLNGKFVSYNGKVDIDYFLGEIKNYVINCSQTEYLYHQLIADRRVPVHSIVWKALKECVNMELKWDGLQCTSKHLKKWFQDHGLEYKEALKPLINELSQEREEMITEKEEMKHDQFKCK